MARLPYVRTMFATCMLFQVIYVLCVVLWLAFPELKGHALLPAIFPNFTLLSIGSFIFGHCFRLLLQSLAGRSGGLVRTEGCLAIRLRYIARESARIIVVRAVSVTASVIASSASCLASSASWLALSFRPK